MFLNTCNEHSTTETISLVVHEGLKCPVCAYIDALKDEIESFKDEICELRDIAGCGPLSSSSSSG